MRDDIFMRKISDVHRLSEKYQAPCFSKFLDGAEQAEIKSGGVSGMLFGGYDGAERCMLGAFPSWYEPESDSFPISALFIRKKYKKELSHRDYLGTILSLGIERDNIGDILVTEEGAYVFVTEEMADFIAGGISKVAGCGAEVKKCDLNSVKVPERKFSEINAVAGSLRLDAVLAAMLKVSRNAAKEMLSSGKVSVNHTEESRGDFLLKEGDLLSVRGFGRALLADIGGKTRSDRVHITLKKYI